MDTCRRRKTVFAGTFAIARKSVSNSRPITLVERNVLHRIRKGYTRAMYQHLSHCLREIARASVRASGGAALDLGSALKATRGQNSEFGAVAPTTRTRATSETPRAIFILNAKIPGAL